MFDLKKVDQLAIDETVTILATGGMTAKSVSFTIKTSLTIWKPLKAVSKGYFVIRASKRVPLLFQFSTLLSFTDF